MKLLPRSPLSKPRLTLLAAIAVLWCACSTNRATEVSNSHRAAPPAVVKADAHGWIYLENGQNLQIVGHVPFQVDWLFASDPCAKPMQYKAGKSLATGNCTVAATASGAYAFQIDGQPGPLSFVRVGRGDTKLTVPLEAVQARLRAKEPIRIANVALGCRQGKAEAVPAELPVSRREFVSWTRLGARPQWTATFDNASVCGQARLDAKNPFCTLGSSELAQTYTIALEGCPQPGTAKLVPAK